MRSKLCLVLSSLVDIEKFNPFIDNNFLFSDKTYFDSWK